MSAEIENHIGSLFMNLSEYEHKIELIRQNLAEFEEFEPYAAFQRISRMGKGYISQKEISEFLEFNGMNSYEKDLEFLIRVYDSNDDKKLSYRDFLNFILPHSSPELRQICTQRQSYAVNADEILPWEIEFKLAKLIELEISLFNETDSNKNAIVNLPDFNLKDIFALLAGPNGTWIDMSSLAEFFAKLSFHFKEHDLFCIIKRIDKDQDGSICYSDFVEFILPIKPYTRLSLNSALNRSNLDLKTSPGQSKIGIPNTHLFPAHFKCYSCNVGEEKNNPMNRKFLHPNDYDIIANQPTEKNIGNRKFMPSENELSDNNYRSNLVSAHSKENPQEVMRDSKASLPARENPAGNKRNMPGVEALGKKTYGTDNTCYTNLTYTQSNRDSFRTPTKNSFAETNRNAYFSTKPLQNNKIQNNDTAKDFKVLRDYRNPEKREDPNVRKYQSKSFMGPSETPPVNPSLPHKDEPRPMMVSAHYTREPQPQTMEPSLPQREEIRQIPTKMIINEEIKIQLKDLFYLDKSIKLYMEELYEDFDVDLNEIYRFFDSSRQEKIDAKSLELKLKEFEIFISKFEIYCFVEKYDGESKGFLNFSEFSLAFISKFPFPERKNEKHSSSTKISRNYERKLAKILGLVINFECDCLMLKKLAEKNASFSFLDLYVEHFKGEIVLEDYLEFIRRYDLQMIEDTPKN